MAGITHFNKVSGIHGIFVGSAGQEVQIADENGIIFGLPEPGTQFYVNSATGSDSNSGLSWDFPMATLDAAIGKCTASKGDIIWIAPGHAETWTTTGAKVVADIAGITIIGLGAGASRPTFSFGHTGTTWTISAASVTLFNLLLVSAVDSITTFGTISGTDCTLLDIETRDTTDVEVIDTFIVTGDRLTVKNHFHNGYTGGNANARVFKMTGVDNALFEDCRWMTKVTTGVINFVTTASTNVVIKNCDFLVTSTTDLSKDVVATIGSNTYEVHNCFDIGGGCSFSGGSGDALMKDDVGATHTAVDSVGTRVGSVGTQATSLGTQVGSVGTQATSVGTLTSSVGTLATSVGTATGSVGTLTASVGTQATSIGTQAGSVGTLVASVGTVAGTLSTSTALANALTSIMSRIDLLPST